MRIENMSFKWLTAVLPVLLAGVPGRATGEVFIVKDGEARAEIVIAEHPPRMVRLAAEELQSHIEKISGAVLPVVTEPGTTFPVTLYVGRSAHTDRLGLDADGLDDGAYRIVSGAHWLALLGRDADFEPTEPYTMQPSARHPDRARMLAAWDALSGGVYDNPFGVPHRRFNRRHGWWAYDERGSLNAVYAFLRDLGVRWYMPGELGEVLPELADILLPETNKTVRPAYGLRAFSQMSTTYFSLGADDLLWQLRLGLNAHSEAYGRHQSHGLRYVLSRPEMKAAQPEYYAATADGRRRTDTQHACLSAPGLVEETVRYARAMFEVYDAPTVSVWPEDGFNFCRCDLCAGRDTPERGRVGTHSDYVWGFVERVARELLEQYPDRTVTCGAYGTYTLPPEQLDRLSPNVQVAVVHARGWRYPEPTERGLELPLPELRAAWQAKTDRPLLGYEHYPLGSSWPISFTRRIDAAIKDQWNDALGEFVEIAWGPLDERGHGLQSPAFFHLNVYVTSRLYWEPNLDLDALLDEYFERFYGPAAGSMQALIEHCEAHWRAMRESPELADPVFERIEAARKATPPESVYRARVEGVDDYLGWLRMFRAQRARPLEGLPEARIYRPRPVRSVTLDGRLDEPFWRNLTDFRGFRLHAPDGGAPAVRTAFGMFWDDNALYLAVFCEDPDTANLTVTGGEDDPAILDGDTIELLIETQTHRYYHLVVNPAGARVEFDRRDGRANRAWTSGAEVATHVGDGFWSAEFRIPVTHEHPFDDPVHGIAGWRPNDFHAWFVNIGRRRVRNGTVEHAMWSPTGDGDIHDPAKFGRLFVVR